MTASNIMQDFSEPIHAHSRRSSLIDFHSARRSSPLKKVMTLVNKPFRTKRAKSAAALNGFNEVEDRVETYPRTRSGANGPKNDENAEVLPGAHSHSAMDVDDLTALYRDCNFGTVWTIDSAGSEDSVELSSPTNASEFTFVASAVDSPPSCVAPTPLPTLEESDHSTLDDSTTHTVDSVSTDLSTAPSAAASGSDPDPEPDATASPIASPKKRVPLRLRLDPSKRPPPLSSLALNFSASGPAGQNPQRRKLSSPSIMFRRLSAIFSPNVSGGTCSPQTSGLHPLNPISPALSSPSSPSSTKTLGRKASRHLQSSNTAAKSARRLSLSLLPPDAPFCLKNLQTVGPKGAEKYLAKHYDRITEKEKKRARSPSSPTGSRTTTNLDPYSLSVAEANPNANRYMDILPYERSRLRLNDGSYINASNILSVDSNVRYIAAQGPLPDTQGQFWRMVFEQKSRVIVMLAREVENYRAKVHGYWPKVRGQVLSLPDQGLEVILQHEMDHPETQCVIRTLEVTDGEERLTLTQVHYQNWPDHGVPSRPDVLLGIIQLANMMQQRCVDGDDNSVDQVPGPMVVHCSAGVGRSGTFCVVDSVLAHLKIPGFGIASRPMTAAEKEALVIGPPEVAAEESTGSSFMNFLSRPPQTPLVSSFSLLPANPPQTPMASSFSSQLSNPPQTPMASSFSSQLANPPSTSQTSGGSLATARAHDPDIIYAMVEHFRQQRSMMVQTPGQYIYCYGAVKHGWMLARLAESGGPSAATQMAP